MTNNPLHPSPLIDCRLTHLRWCNCSTQRLSQGTVVVLASIAATSLWGFNTAAQAQAAFGNFGITTPSERFRQEGQQRIEQEIDRLYAPLTETLLTIDDRVNIQEDLLQLEDLRWHLLDIPQPDGPDDRDQVKG
ncbi:hypothetical protein [Thermocoleostomius sinensis]|uniref:Uncharacterized protein n=1 Tax=Thermocoleostomius sinensis A174 TaxID=2016057 RepID=A0A9E8ZIC5_9CYAN|nr:hypothetical protein [Thermocoleostomius sinensis]WAL59051.1 hypothetical protein OXH18_17985 [Thermocoleostomius sinensis A174]